MSCPYPGLSKLRPSKCIEVLVPIVSQYLTRRTVELMQIVAYDFGIKHNILRRLASFGCKITVVPADYPASKVLEMNPDGIFLSNGPVSCALHLLLLSRQLESIPPWLMYAHNLTGLA